MAWELFLCYSGDMEESNGWKEWKKHVLIELKDHKEQMTQVHIAINNLSVQNAKLEVKSGMWGALGGLIMIITAYLVSRVAL